MFPEIEKHNKNYSSSNQSFNFHDELDYVESSSNMHSESAYPGNNNMISQI